MNTGLKATWALGKDERAGVRGELQGLLLRGMKGLDSPDHERLWLSKHKFTVGWE